MESLKMTDLMCYHGESSKAKLNKATKAELIQLIIAEGSQYANDKEYRTKAEASLSDRGSQYNQARTMIASFLGYDLRDKDYHKEPREIEGLTLSELVAQIMSVSDSQKFTVPQKIKCD